MTKRMILPLVLLVCTTALGADEKEITVKLTVPDAAWTIAIDEVHKVGNESWVIAIVSRMVLINSQDDAGQCSPEQHTRSFRISEAAKEAALSIFSFAYVPPVVRGLPFAGLNSREPANGHTVIICQMLILLYLMYSNLFEGTFYHVRL